MAARGYEISLPVLRSLLKYTKTFSKKDSINYLSFSFVILAGKYCTHILQS